MSSLEEYEWDERSEMARFVYDDGREVVERRPLVVPSPDLAAYFEQAAAYYREQDEGRREVRRSS